MSLNTTKPRARVQSWLKAIFRTTILVTLLVGADAEGLTQECDKLRDDYLRALQAPEREEGRYHLASLLRLGDLEVLCRNKWLPDTGIKHSALLGALEWYVSADSFYLANRSSLPSEIDSDHELNLMSALFYLQGLIVLADSNQNGAKNSDTRRLLQKVVSLQAREHQGTNSGTPKSDAHDSIADDIEFVYEYAQRLASGFAGDRGKLWNMRVSSAYPELQKLFEFLTLYVSYRKYLATGVEELPRQFTTTLGPQPDDLVSAFIAQAETKKCVNSLFMAGQMLLSKGESDSAMALYKTALQKLDTRGYIQDATLPFIYAPYSPDRRLADDIQYEIAGIHEKRGRESEARLALAKVVRFYLGSDKMQDALKKLRQLKHDG